MDIDLFISYARADNRRGQVTALKEQIEADYRAFAKEEVRCFFDQDDIRGMDDWRGRILDSLRRAHIFLMVLSPAYLDSPYCEWEIVEFLKYEHSRAVGGEGVAPVYFVEIPGLDDPDFQARKAAWVGAIRQRQHFDLRPWHESGAAALQQEDVRRRLEELRQALLRRLTRLRRLAAAPGNLPAANPHFVGRTREMARLHDAVGRGRVGVLTALQGMGGLGKTALALQYAYAYADFYPGGRWLLNCAGAPSLAAVVRRLDGDLGVSYTEAEQLDDDLAARRLLRELEDLSRRNAAARAGEPHPPDAQALLLLDNVAAAELLQPPQADLLSGRPWLRVLATTRLGPGDFGYDPVGGAADPARPHELLAVDELPTDDGVSLIESYQPRGRFAGEDERGAAAEIVRLLGGFTLAVEVAAVYLGEKAGRISCAAYRERLRQEGLAGQEEIARQSRRAVPHVEKLVSATLAPTLALLSPAASLVLAYAALLPPDLVPLPWLRALAARDYPDLAQDAPPGYEDPWLDLVNRLLSLRLLHLLDLAPDGGTPRLVRVHRLVQDLVGRHLGTKEAGARREDLLTLVRGRDAALENTTAWTEARWEVAPLEALALLRAEQGEKEAAWLLNQVGQRWHHLAEWARAEPLMRRALAIDEASFGPDHPDVAIDLNNLAGLLRATNRLAEAEPLYRRALAIDEAGFGPDHPTVAIDLNNLAGLLADTNRLAEAEPLYRRALAIDEAGFGPDHPKVAIRLNNLAELLRATNRLAEAEPLYRRALAIDEASFGPDHPDVARDLNNLALLLWDTNRLDEAEPLYRRALAIYEASFGPNHPNVATALNNLAELLRATNRLAEAEPLYRRALAIDEASFGPDHPTVAIDLNNLAELLRDTNRPAEAEPLYRRVVAIFEQSLGPEHPNVATALNNLAGLLQDTNRLAEAEPLYRRALAIDEASFGPDHPNVAIRLNNLALLLRATNRLAEAEPLSRRHLQIFLGFTRATGHVHPHLQAAVNNYAGLLLKMGYREAEILARLQELAPEFFEA